MLFIFLSSLFSLLSSLFPERTHQNKGKKSLTNSFMAVEAGHINSFPSQFLNDRANMIIGGIRSDKNVQTDFSDLPLPSAFPSSASSSMADQSLFQFYQSSTLCDPNSAKTSINNNDDSGLTYNNFSSSSRKRSRDEFITEFNHPRTTKFSSSPFLDHDLHLQIQNQQFEIDFLIAQHTEKVRMELEEERRRQTRVLYSAIQGVMTKKLKEKDEEIQKIGKMNWALQERVKTLAQENQILMQLAQTNEATANSLRSNLEHLLAAVEAGHVGDDYDHHRPAEVDDAESSCGSSGDGCEVSHRLEKNSGRLCRKCGVRESIVLLLPCRHLSLCTMCGSSCHNCPVCHSEINGSVHVNFS